MAYDLRKFGFMFSASAILQKYLLGSPHGYDRKQHYHALKNHQNCEGIGENGRATCRRLGSHVTPPSPLANGATLRTRRHGDRTLKQPPSSIRTAR
jgi:hypothetical protein